MTDKQFDDFIKKSIQNFGDEYIDFDCGMNESHEFSSRYNRKISRIKVKRRREKISFPRMTLKIGISFAFSIAAIISLMLFNGSGDYHNNPFIIQHFDTLANLSVRYDPDAPKKIEDKYAITKIPEGFEMKPQNEMQKSNAFYRIEYTNGKDRIVFRQIVKSKFYPLVDNEKCRIYFSSISDYDALFFDRYIDNCYSVYWDSEDYVMQIEIRGENVSEEALIELAESVKKVEN